MPLTIEALRETLRTKPIAFAVGLEKCGTTSFNDLLRLADNISTPKQKELQYFSVNYDKGIDWFLARHDLSKDVLVDFTPTYHWKPEFLNRIETDCANKAALVMLRHPIDRAYSAYVHQRMWFFENEYKAGEIAKYSKTFAEALDGRDRFITPSYLKIIERVKQAFGEAPVKVAPLEDVIADPAKYIGFLEARLGFAFRFNAPIRLPRSNAIHMPQFFGGAELNEMRPADVKTDFDKDWVYIVRDGIPRKIAPVAELGALRILQEMWMRPVSATTGLQAFATFYEQETAELEKLLGLGLDQWRAVKDKQPKTLAPFAAV
jgi:hypothetical protein